MGAVVSCIKSLFRTIGNCIMAVISGIGGILTAIINGIVSFFGIIINCLTCRGGRSRKTHGGGMGRGHHTSRV